SASRTASCSASPSSSQPPTSRRWNTFSWWKCSPKPSRRKAMIFYPVTFLLLLVTFVVQEFIPGIPMAHYATLFLPPVFFFAASVAVPYPVMILLAFVAGTLWDARHMPVGAASQAAQSLMTGTDEFSTTG